VLGDVSSPGLEIKVDRVGTLITHLGKNADYFRCRLMAQSRRSLCWWPKHIALN